MFCDLVLAFAMLTSPIPDDYRPTQLELNNCLILSRKLNTINQTEFDGWVNLRYDNWAFVRYLHGRYLDDKRFPLEEEHKRWPETYEEIKEKLKINLEYQDDLKAKMSVVQWCPIEEEALDEARAMYTKLQLLGYIKGIPQQRREYLNQLRDLMGPAAFYRGDPIYALPFWRIPR